MSNNPYDTLTDEELVAKIVKTSDSSLFGLLYDRYADNVYRKCNSFSRSDKEAEDLTQDVFLMLFIKLGSFKGKSKFSSWLYALTYNFCVNYVNRDKARKMRDRSNPIDDDKIGLAVEDDSLYQLQSEKLKKALLLVSPEDRKLLLLKYQDDVPIKELSIVLEAGESAIKMRLKRAKSRILEAYKMVP